MEVTYIPNQTVAGGQNALFNTSVPCPKGYVIHENGSGLVTLRGIVNNACGTFARYRCVAITNAAISAGETVAPISIALSKNGETILSSVAILTPQATEAYNHICLVADVNVPRGCCAQLTLKNISADGTSVDLQNSKLDVFRVA